MDCPAAVQKPTIEIIGIDCRTSNAPDAGPQDIPKLWGRFYKEDVLSKIPNKASGEVIALYCDYEGDHTQPYRVIIGCPVTSLEMIPEGMVGKAIPASAYALFQSTGPYPASLIDTWQSIWQQPQLPRTYTGDFELYSEQFLAGSSQDVEVYIAIP